MRSLSASLTPGFDSHPEGRLKVAAWFGLPRGTFLPPLLLLLLPALLLAFELRPRVEDAAAAGAGESMAASGEGDSAAAEAAEEEARCFLAIVAAVRTKERRRGEESRGTVHSQQSSAIRIGGRVSECSE